MSEDTTRNLPSSFEERVLSELAAIRQEAVQQNARLTSLEEKVDARLRETRPMWESVQAQLKGIDNRLDILSRQFKTFLQDLSELRARVERLEDSQPTG
jgi:septal ring factor EnvC (AmiA/AmiB activator)